MNLAVKARRMAYQEKLIASGRCPGCSRLVEPLPGKKRRPVYCSVCRAKARGRAARVKQTRPAAKPSGEAAGLLSMPSDDRSET